MLKRVIIVFPLQLPILRILKPLSTSQSLERSGLKSETTDETTKARDMWKM